jgi:hypothetical protein
LCDGHSNPGNSTSTDLNQTLFETIYTAMVDRSRVVDGVPTSLLDLGYRSAGLDDWYVVGLPRKIAIAPDCEMEMAGS